MRMKNVSMPQQQVTSSVAETDDDFIEVKVEETVLPGHVKHKVATEETNIEECTPQNVRSKIPNVGTSEDSGGSISPAAEKKSVKVSVNLAQVKSPF